MAKGDTNSPDQQRGTMSATHQARRRPMRWTSACSHSSSRSAGSPGPSSEGGRLDDREALKKQIASVRDGAGEVLEQLGGAPESVEEETTAAARGAAKGRSGGVVEQPARDRREPVATDSGARIANSQAGQDADGKDDGQDEPAPRAWLADVELTKWWLRFPEALVFRPGHGDQSSPRAVGLFDALS